MRNGLYLDHKAKVAVFHEGFDITPDYLAFSLAVLSHKAFPAEYDNVSCFSSRARLDVSIEALIRHAMQIHQLQRQRTDQRVRSVLVNIPESGPITTEIWNTFFQEPDTSIEMMAAESVEKAYCMLGKGQPCDLLNQTSAEFYNELLADSPLAAQS